MMFWWLSERSSAASLRAFSRSLSARCSREIFLATSRSLVSATSTRSAEPKEPVPMLRTSRTLEAYTSAVMALRRSRVPPELSISAGTATAAAASQKPLCSEDSYFFCRVKSTNAPI